MSQLMPALFVGHGSPMNAIENNAFHRSWVDLGRSLPRPRAIVCVSAHWETRGSRISAAATPETIHDFYGFPAELFAVRYPALGDPELAARIARHSNGAPITLDHQRGIDHGAWSVLRAMYPSADIPLLQLSLDTTKTGAEHYALGQQLGYLRDEGVLLLASGNIAHNLGLYRFNSNAPLSWAARFQHQVNQMIGQREHDALCNFAGLGDDAALAIPTAEHFLPLLYALAWQRDSDRATFFNDEVTSSISMTSLCIEP